MADPTTTTTSGGAPTVIGSIALTPDDGGQNPSSLQVAKSVTLKLTWSSTGADTVDISGVGTGLPASGEQALVTQDATYTLVANGSGGKSVPQVIGVETHDDGAAVSNHSDVSSGVASVISFAATKDNQLISSACAGDEIVLTAVVSDATDSVKINGNDADLTEQGNGQKQGTLTLTLDASMDGSFNCQAIKDGNVAQDQSVHIDIGPAATTTLTPATTTTAPPTTTTAASTTTTAAPTTTTAAPATTTAAPTTTTVAPTTTTAAPTTTTAPPTTTTAAPTTTTAAPTTTTLAPSTTTTAAPTTTSTHPGSTTTAPGTTTSHPGTTTTSDQATFSVSDFSAVLA